MPNFHAHHVGPNGQPDPAKLQQLGPLIQIEIAVPDPLVQVIVSAGGQVPNPVTGRALVDTGASATCVDHDLLVNLGLKPVSTISVCTPSDGAAQQFVFPAKVGFPGSPIPSIPIRLVVGATLANQGIIALIGRDILKNWIMYYDGNTGQVTFSV